LKLKFTLNIKNEIIKNINGIMMSTIIGKIDFETNKLIKEINRRDE
jgi:hypothetical protein